MPRSTATTGRRQARRGVGGRAGARSKAYIQKKNELNARLAPFYNAYIFRELAAPDHRGAAGDFEQLTASTRNRSRFRDLQHLEDSRERDSRRGPGSDEQEAQSVVLKTYVGLSYTARTKRKIFGPPKVLSPWADFRQLSAAPRGCRYSTKQSLGGARLLRRPFWGTLSKTQ
jgi:hypothetical protein